MNRIPPAIVVLALLAVFGSAAACAGRTPVDPGVPGVAPDGLRGRTYLSTAVTEGGTPRQLAESTRVTLRFTDDGRLLADAGCNTMSGPVDTRGGRIAVSDLAVTEMGCDQPRHQQDEWLARFLQATPSWRLDGTDLVLTAGGTELALADREVAEPDLPLEGTRWVVDTLVDGEVAASTPAGAEATIVFDAGTAEVSTGCNSGTASYQVDGDTLAVGALTLTRKACEPDLMRLEQAVVAVLDGQLAFAVDADRLRLEHPSGRQLQLRGDR